MGTKYVSIEEPKFIVRYKGMTYSFDIESIDAVFVTKKRIPYYGIIRILLFLFLGPLLVFCLRADSMFIVGYVIIMYCLLYALHESCIYMLCIFTKDGEKMRIRIRQCEKRDFIEEVTCFLEDYNIGKEGKTY